MYLGVKAVIASSIERIHSANLVNFGIMPLLFDNPGDYDAIAENAKIAIREIRKQLRPGGTVKAALISETGEKKAIRLRHNLTEEDIKIVLAGGRLRN